jgi:hypothetical protein
VEKSYFRIISSTFAQYFRSDATRLQRDLLYKERKGKLLRVEIVTMPARPAVLGQERVCI